MPGWVASLLVGLASYIPTLVGRIMLSLGFGYAVYSGVDVLATAARDSLIARIGAGGAVMVQLAGVLQIGTCINIFVSAILAKLVVQGLTNGVLTKLVTKG